MFLKSDEESELKSKEKEKGKGLPNEQESLITKMRRFSVGQLQVEKNKLGTESKITFNQ